MSNCCQRKEKQKTKKNPNRTHTIRDTINTPGKGEKVKYRTTISKRRKANNKEIPVFNTFTASIFETELIVARCLMLVILRGKTASKMTEN